MLRDVEILSRRIQGRLVVSIVPPSAPEDSEVGQLEVPLVLVHLASKGHPGYRTTENLVDWTVRKAFVLLVSNS